jgi:hypothetical protein
MESVALEIGRLYAYRENPRAKNAMLKVKLVAKVGRGGKVSLHCLTETRLRETREGSNRSWSGLCKASSASADAVVTGSLSSQCVAV